MKLCFIPVLMLTRGGRPFWWNGNLYRGITYERASFYRHIFDRGIVQNLIDRRLLVETELTPLRIEGYELVLKHRSIPFVSYAFEWSAAMLKDAALLVIDLSVALARSGLTLQDAHNRNVLFDGYMPVHVDFTSIVPDHETGQWWPQEQFFRFFIRPLLLMSKGYDRIARWLLRDFKQGVLESDLAALDRHSWRRLDAKTAGEFILSTAHSFLPSSLHPVLRKALDLPMSKRRRTSEHGERQLDRLRKIRKKVESIPLPNARTEWSNYYDNRFPSLTSPEAWTAKHQNVYQVLAETRPETVLDIGSNRGWYSQLAGLSGSSAVAFDADEATMTRLYRDAKVRRLPILPLVMDLRNPSPGYGLFDGGFPPATERLKCEMVMALAIVHHLVVKQGFNFAQVAKALSIFSERWLLVEFAPREDPYIREWSWDEFPWYTLENFQSALRKHFRVVRMLPSHPSPRVLLLCEK